VVQDFAHPQGALRRARIERFRRHEASDAAHIGYLRARGMNQFTPPP
jgi:hypothetical protein